MKLRILTILSVLALGLGLTGAMLALAQGGAPTPAADDAEEARELAAAAALAADPGPLLAPHLRAAAVFTPPAVISAPLFVGADDTALFTYLVDPDTAAAHPLYDGFRVWGAAFDPISRTVYFNHGPNLYAWPLDGAPGGLGTVKSAASGTNLSFYGLAAADGALYGTMPLGSVANPEGVYQIDPATLSATLVITYAAPADVDMGGLAADPAGDLYGTNDETPQQGLVRINPNGTLDLLAPYPDGQNDIDGLAIGDGRAYLVPDQPGQIYVFDFATLTYTAPITNPWTTNELFSGADWISEPAVVTPTISLTKTVGTDPNVCATTKAITLAESGDVTYCYEVINTGPITLTLHTLADSELGDVLNDFPYTLVPGASAFLTATASITQTTVNTATWTAYNPGPVDVATATATATVTVNVLEPAIAITKSVGIDPNTCAPTDVITVTVGTSVTYCYTVNNTGSLTLTLHTLQDSELGDVLNDFPYNLVPGGSAFITETTTVTQTTVNTATWTAYNPGPTDVVTATDTAKVNVAIIETAPDIGVTPVALSVLLEVNDQQTQTVTLDNSGNGTLNWLATLAVDSCATPGGVPWAAVAPPQGTIAPSENGELTVSFDATGLAAGPVTGILCLTSNDPDEPLVIVPLNLTVNQVEYQVHLAVIMGSPAGGTRGPDAP